MKKKAWKHHPEKPKEKVLLILEVQRESVRNYISDTSFLPTHTPRKKEQQATRTTKQRVVVCMSGFVYTRLRGPVFLFGGTLLVSRDSKVCVFVYGTPMAWHYRSTAGTWLPPLCSTVCISPFGFRSNGIFSSKKSDGAENGPYKGLGSLVLGWPTPTFPLSVPVQEQLA